MPVLTQQQYKESKDKFDPIKRETAKPIEKAVVSKLPEIFYVLLHPENEINNLKNFQDEVELDGVKYKRDCIRGIVKTKDKPLADFLVSQEYKLIGETNG